MKPLPKQSSFRPRFRLPACALPAGFCLALLTASSQAGPIPQNLGYGLDKLVESNLLLKGQVATTDGTPAVAAYNGYATEAAANVAATAISESGTGRLLVDITLGGNVPFNKVRNALEASYPSLTITAVDKEYRGVGIIEGYVNVDDVPALSQVKGVRAVILALKPETNRVLSANAPKVAGKTTGGPAPAVIPGQTLTKLGTAFDQGVVQHRIDYINQFYNPGATLNITGNGISVGAMSDSFDTRAAAPHAADNVASFDLPGSTSNPAGNTTPVNVLVDDPAPGTDEGRGMVQNIYKMAPKAKLAYATGVNGEVAFANYIRAMANIPGYENTFGGTVPFKGFKADVICDDISYGGEPFYGETIIGNGIDDAAAVGVSYFSSAGNNIGINSYESALRIVPNGTGVTAATNTALAGTNIDLTGVPANLYAGGFHNFNPNGQDVAQLWNLPATLATSQGTEMQWDDPYDIRTPSIIQPPLYSNTGSITATGQTVTFNDIPNLTQGTSYVFQETATSGNFDGIVTIIDPNGNVIASQDTGTDETVTFFAPVSGHYTVQIAAYDTTTGSFNFTVNTSTATLLLTTDLNLLLFRADTGAYFGTRSLTSNNLATNRPVELGLVTAPTGQTQVQFVIARANQPTAPRLPTRVRVSVRGNGGGGIGPAEYFTYNAVTTKGHATAKGCNGTAAYSVFRPNTPETFTSPGPATILFDKNANLLPTPEIRLSPKVAAIDAANTSDFPLGSDSASDPDANPNFSGTSSAAPHAAAIAALVLEAKGGPGSVTPAQMTSILQRSAYPHDLDPSSASASVRTSNGGKLTINITSDGDANTGTGQNDPNSFAVSYVGSGSIASLVFNPGGTGATGGNVTGGANGELDTNGTPTSPTVTYFQIDAPGLVFETPTKAFTLGNSTGLTAADVVATPSNPAGAPTPAGAGFYTLSLNFPTGNFTGGKVLRFTVGRGAQRSSNVATGGTTTVPGPGTTTVNPLADLFGGGVMVPGSYDSATKTYSVITNGMSFSGTTTDGGTFSGTIKNRIGAGYSPVDGFGLINAEAAVSQTVQ